MIKTLLELLKLSESTLEAKSTKIINHCLIMLKVLITKFQAVTNASLKLKRL